MQYEKSDYFTKGNKSEEIQLKGKVTWVCLHTLNKYEKWSLNYYPDAASLEIFRDLQLMGVKNKLKKDDDGIFFQLSRPSFIELRKGIKTPVTEPWVKDADGNPIDGSIVGDGSDVIITCEKYTHPIPNSEKRDTAIRLMGINVINLIPR